MTVESSIPRPPISTGATVTTEEPTRYRERTPWALWVDIVYCSAILACCYPALVGWDTHLLARLGITAAIVASGWGLRRVLGGLTVLVRETRIVIHLGSVALVRKVVPFADIVSLGSVRYRPLVEFGGWGVRGARRKQAWTARGDRAVVIGLPEGHRLYVGSDHPQRLEEAIRSAVGSQTRQQD